MDVVNGAARYQLRLLGRPTHRATVQVTLVGPRPHENTPVVRRPDSVSRSQSAAAGIQRPLVRRFIGPQKLLVRALRRSGRLLYYERHTSPTVPAPGAGTGRGHRAREERDVDSACAPDITTTKGLRDRAILDVLLDRALRRCSVAALTDGRSPGAFTPGATVAARHANTPERSV
jgi:hypothetical protein